jgi:hypothetical protein
MTISDEERAAQVAFVSYQNDRLPHVNAGKPDAGTPGLPERR